MNCSISRSHSLSLLVDPKNTDDDDASNPLVDPPPTYIPFHDNPCRLSALDFPKNSEKRRFLSIPSKFLAKIKKPRMYEKQHLVKIAVLGASKTGKSCCISRYISDSFQGLQKTIDLLLL